MSYKALTVNLLLKCCCTKEQLTLALKHSHTSVHHSCHFRGNCLKGKEGGPPVWVYFETHSMKLVNLDLRLGKDGGLVYHRRSSHTQPVDLGFKEQKVTSSSVCFCRKNKKWNYILANKSIHGSLIVSDELYDGWKDISQFCISSDLTNNHQTLWVIHWNQLCRTLSVFPS